eukprot:TRINITY_DN121465_c1_g1_i1.p1 TRINITY_DN121465_c1_g1~~TRINITY_DN121465_c1_g1_i1.p1  ORF type:complete len:705 (+),score=93.99 TRINITY_DN121465_c1_g1_i1:136-2115(+)
MEGKNKLSLNYRNETSYHGIPLKVLKSALQKYLRRNDMTKGLWCLLELQTFDLAVGKDIERSQKSIRTNTINRMIVMMSEEININNVWLPVILQELYQKITKFSLPKEKVWEIEKTMYYLLQSSRKCRLISDIRTVFNLPEYYLQNYEAIEKIHRMFLAQYPQINELVYNIKYEHATKKELLEMLRQSLQERSMSAFSTVTHIFYGFKGNDRIKHAARIWDVVFNISNQYEDSIKALKYFFDKLKHKERFIYLYHAILLIVVQPDKTKDPKDMKKYWERENYTHFIEMSEKMSKEHLHNPPIELDDFVYDIHTSSKAKPEGLVTFATEGTLVKDECKDYLDLEYRKLYVEFKQVLQNHLKTKAVDESILTLHKSSPILQFKARSVSIPMHEITPEKSQEIMQLPQAQLRTAKFKKAVFVGVEEVYKGKFKKEEAALINTIIYTEAIKTLEKIEVGMDSISVQDILKVLKVASRDEYYLVWKNYGDISKAIIETLSSKLEQNIKVIKRGSMVSRISELEKTGELTKEEKVRILQHLYVCFLLGCGDYGTHNMLKSKDGQIVGIDFEEKRKKPESKKKIVHLMKLPSKLQEEIYDKFISKISVVKNLSKETKDKLSELDPTLVDEVENNIKLWETLHQLLIAYNLITEGDYNGTQCIVFII